MPSSTAAAFDRDMRTPSIEEKPAQSRRTAPPYFCDANVIRREILARSELEIVAVNRIQLERDKLSVEFLRRGYARVDTGTPDSLVEAGELVRA
jgi:glucose-1-phosphate thymidylyltransferase